MWCKWHNEAYAPGRMVSTGKGMVRLRSDLLHELRRLITSRTGALGITGRSSASGRLCHYFSMHF